MVGVLLRCPAFTKASSSLTYGIRQYHKNTVALEKYYKITRYTKPIDTTKYKAGDSREGLSIPFFKKKYPDYAYETMFFKRQNRGLYGGLQRTRSKTCSESRNKNLRSHVPNVVKSKLWSETLNKAIHTRVSTSLLRTITKEGGLDNYLLKDKPARIKTMGLKGWKLRYEIMKKKDLESLPKVEKDGKLHQVYYIHDDGKRIVVGKNKLLKELWNYAQRDTYTPITWKEYLRNHSYLTLKELVSKLENYGFDFAKVTA